MMIFPERLQNRLFNFLWPIIMKIPVFRERFYKKEMKPGMIRSLQKAVEQA